jgi:hypothetical protein
MSTPKISINDLEKRGMIQKFERDGLTRAEIHKQMYKLTDGMQTPQRTDLMKKLYDREYVK